MVIWLWITASLALKWWRSDMARKSAFLSFIESFNAGFDTVNKVGKDYELSKLAQEKETPVYNPDQVDQRATIAGAVDSEGKPLYTVDTAPDGQTRVQSNLPGDDGTQPQPFNIAAQGTQYMGKTFDRALTDSDRVSAKNLAMSGILTKYGDAEGAMRFQDAALRTQRQDKQDAQGEQRFSWDKARTEREQKLGAEADVDKETMRGVDQKTADWFKSRLANPDGTQRPATIDDHLAASQYRAGALTEAGKVDAAGKVIADHNSQSLIKIQLETAQRDQDLAKTASALAAGDLNSVKDFYNKYVPDGAKVVNVSRDGKGQISIERESLDGKPMPPTVLKDTGQLTTALASFKDPMALYNWTQNEFRNNLALRADSRAGAAEGRAAASAADGKKEEAAKVAAGIAIYKETNPNATPAQLEAVRTGILAAIPKTDANAPAEVKLAQAFINAGLDKDMASALRRASNSKNDSPEKFYQDVYKDALKTNYGDSAKAKAVADQAMKDRPEVAAAASTPTKPANEADAQAQAKAAVAGGADKTAVNARLKTLGFKPID
jgi:hypothetical protein